MKIHEKIRQTREAKDLSQGQKYKISLVESLKFMFILLHSSCKCYVKDVNVTYGTYILKSMS